MSGPTVLLVLALPDPQGLEGLEQDLLDLPVLSRCFCAADADLARRTQAVEARLIEHLRLPDGLGLSLSRDASARRAALEDGDALVGLYHESAGTLFDLRVSLDGERVTREHFAFADEQGTAERTRDLLAGRWAFPQPLRMLPSFFEGVERFAEAIVARGMTLVSVAPISGSTSSTPHYFQLTYTARPQGRDDCTLHASEYLVLDEGWDGGAPWVHVGDDRVTIESVARALRRDLGQTLNENLSLFAALDLPFPHSVDLRDLGPDHRELSVLVPWPRGERCLTYAHLRREIGVEDGWRVTEGTGTRWGESVPLAHYVALARAVVATVEGRHVSLGAFAVAGGDRESTALVVTVPEGSLWHTTMGTIHVLVSDGTSPRFVERVSLTEFDIDHLRFVDGVRTSRQVLRARASDGRALEVEVIPNPCRTKNEPNPLVRLGATQAVLLGGSALGDRAGPY